MNQTDRLNRPVSPDTQKQVGLAIITGSFENGIGTYETVRVHGGVPFMLEKHLDRVMRAASLLKLNLSISRASIATQVLRTIVAGKLTDAVLHIFAVSSFDGLTFHSKDNHPVGYIVITSSPYIAKSPLLYTKGLHVSVQRFDRVNPEIKDLSQRSAKKHLRTESHYDDVLMENARGEITEATQCNLFLVKNGTLITPATGMLPGVTREVVLELAQNKFPVELRAITKAELLAADEVFLTGSLHNVVPVTKIDGTTVNSGNVGPITKSIMLQFEQLLAASGK